MRRYSTQKRKMLINYLFENKDKFLSAEEIHIGIGDMSVSAVYRNLSELLSDGIVRKSFAKDGHTALYQYCECQKCAHHLHMKCNKCGKVQCINANTSKRVISELGECNDFSIDESKTVIYGLCGACAQDVRGESI